MPATVDTRGLDRLVESWDKLLQRFPEEKRSALDRLGQELLQRVRREIGGSGKVAGWQAPHLGSEGGYVAVRAKPDTYQTTKSGRQYAVGYVTNAIEGGHKVSRPRGGKGYRSRVKVAAVPGRWFYADTRQDLASLSQEEIDTLMQTILDGLEGRL